MGTTNICLQDINRGLSFFSSLKFYTCIQLIIIEGLASNKIFAQ